MYPERKPEATEPKHLSRPEAIAVVRGALLARCGEEECACVAAARCGVFCDGLRSLSDKEFRERFSWIAGSRPHASRAELERLVGLYHLGRQEVDGMAVCCDVETREHCGCDGWNGFDNAALEGAVLAMTGRHVSVG
jgi:hypothetical protein